MTARRWAVAGGVIGAGVETYVLIANTSNIAGNATVTALRSHDGGPAASQTIPLPPNSRVNVPMSQLPGLAEPGGTNFGVLIESDGPEIVIERATYIGLRRDRLGRRSRLAGDAAAVAPELNANSQLPISTPNGAWPASFGSWGWRLAVDVET